MPKSAKPAKTPKPAKTAPPLKDAKPTPPERIPRIVATPTLDDHLEIMSRAIFQAGLSWAFIDSRWDLFRPAFDNFSVNLIALYGDGDIDRLMETEGVVHSRSKLVATVENAKMLLALVAEFGDIPTYVRSFPSYDAVFANAKKRFKFLGDLSCYYWLFRTGLPVMPFEEWMTRQSADHPRMREMVLLGRSENRSSEVAQP
jgi:3-methyladenine DNA glycosylase Tag